MHRHLPKLNSIPLTSVCLFFSICVARGQLRRNAFFGPLCLCLTFRVFFVSLVENNNTRKKNKKKYHNAAFCWLSEIVRAACAMGAEITLESLLEAAWSNNCARTHTQQWPLESNRAGNPLSLSLSLNGSKMPLLIDIIRGIYLTTTLTWAEREREGVSLCNWFFFGNFEVVTWTKIKIRNVSHKLLFLNKTMQVPQIIPH